MLSLRLHQLGLRSLSKCVLGVELDKTLSVRCSDWEAQVLSRQQVETIFVHFICWPFVVIPQCGALRFPDDSLCGWLCSPADTSGLRRHKNVKFGTNVVSSTRTMRAVLYCQNICETAKKANVNVTETAWFWGWVELLTEMCGVSVPNYPTFLTPDYVWRHRASGFSTRYLGQYGALRTPWQ